LATSFGSSPRQRGGNRRRLSIKGVLAGEYKKPLPEDRPSNQIRDRPQRNLRGTKGQGSWGREFPEKGASAQSWLEQETGENDQEAAQISASSQSDDDAGWNMFD